MLTNKPADRPTDHESKHVRQIVLREGAHTVQAACDRSRINRAQAETERARRHRLERENRALANAGTMGWIEGLIAAAICLAVYFIDLSVFSSSADYFGRLVAPTSAIIRNIVRGLIPALVIMFDIWIGIGFWRARRDLQRDPRTRPNFVRWSALAVAFVLLMPLFATGAALASLMTARSDALRQILTAQGLGTAVLALVCHAGILLGAERIERALALFRFRREQAAKLAAETAFQDSAEFNANEAFAAFLEYYDDLQAFNADFGMSLKPGPFDKFTTDLINERLGKELVQALDATSAAFPVPA